MLYRLYSESQTANYVWLFNNKRSDIFNFVSKNKTLFHNLVYNNYTIPIFSNMWHVFFIIFNKDGLNVFYCDYVALLGLLCCDSRDRSFVVTRETNPLPGYADSGCDPENWIGPWICIFGPGESCRPAWDIHYFLRKWKVTSSRALIFLSYCGYELNYVQYIWKPIIVK